MGGNLGICTQWRLKRFSSRDWTSLSACGADSERAFCHLCHQLTSHFSVKPSLAELTRYLKVLSENIAHHGTFNFLLSNGSQLIVHCSTELYWALRKPPYGQLTLLDTQLSIDLSEINNQGETIVVVATKPLTRGEAWPPLGRGEIRVFENGDLAYDLLPDAPVYKTPSDWNRAWASQKVIYS